MQCCQTIVEISGKFFLKRVSFCCYQAGAGSIYKRAEKIYGFDLAQPSEILGFTAKLPFCNCKN